MNTLQVSALLPVTGYAAHVRVGIGTEEVPTDAVLARTATTIYQLETAIQLELAVVCGCDNGYGNIVILGSFLSLPTYNTRQDRNFYLKISTI